MKSVKKNMLVLLALLLLACLSACGKNKSADALAEQEYVLEDYVGAWAYDGAEYCLFFDGYGNWSMYGMDGTYGGSSEYVFQPEVGLTALNGDGSAIGTFLVDSDEALVDTDGKRLQRILLPEQSVPTAYDSLSNSAAFSTVNGTVWYSPQLECTLLSENELFFNPINTDAEGTNVGIWMLLQKITSEFDPYLSRGGATAQTYMKMMARQILENSLGSQIKKSVEAGFVDGGTYYSITTYMMVSGDLFVNGSKEPIYAVAEVRYYGPTGYAAMVLSAAPESKIQNYATIGSVMLNNMDYAGDWSTTPKPVPAKVPEKATIPSKVSSSNSSDRGDYITDFYWSDEDGDVWYWNGYYNVFIGFGDDYYIDDDGQYYESQDYDWDDYYNDYYGDDVWYYYDDYDPWSDPGVWDDAWFAPDDYCEDYEEDWDYDDSYYDDSYYDDSYYDDSYYDDSYYDDSYYDDSYYDDSTYDDSYYDDSTYDDSYYDDSYYDDSYDDSSYYDDSYYDDYDSDYY